MVRTTECKGTANEATKVAFMFSLSAHVDVAVNSIPQTTDTSSSVQYILRSWIIIIAGGLWTLWIVVR